MRYLGPVSFRFEDERLTRFAPQVRTLIGLARRIRGRRAAVYRTQRRIKGDDFDVEVDIQLYGELVIARLRGSVEEEAVAETVAVGSTAAWLPEGFNLRCFSAAAQDGWGLSAPESLADAVWGTPGGPVRDVLINRFAYNKYPDVVFERETGAPVALAYRALPRFFLPGEVPSIGPRSRAGTRYPQFATVGTLADDRAYPFILHEREGERWVCHAPEVPALSEEARGCLDGHNALRAAGDMKPFYPQLRGWDQAASEVAVRETLRTGTVGHSFPGALAGYRTIDERTQLRAAWGGCSAGVVVHGENGMVTPPPTGIEPYAKGRWWAQLWEGSPTHYATLMSGYHREGERLSWPRAGADAPFVELAVATGTVHQRQEPPYRLDSPTVPERATGDVVTATYLGRTAWVGSAPAAWQGAQGRVSWWGTAWYMMEPPGSWYGTYFRELAGGLSPQTDWPTPAEVPFELSCSPALHSISFAPSCRQAIYAPQAGEVYYQGRALTLFSPLVEDELADEDWLGGRVLEVRGAAIQRTDDGLFLNVLLIEAPHALDEPCRLRLMQRDLLQPGEVRPDSARPDAGPGWSRGGFVQVAEFVLPDLTEAVSGAAFSPDGAKCVLSAFVLVPNEGPVIEFNQRDFALDGTVPHPLYGSEVRFIEWAGGEFAELGTERVVVEVEAGSEPLPEAEQWGGTTHRNFYRATCQARYKLLAQYSAEGELEYLEVDTDIQTRQTAKVRLHLNPEDPADKYAGDREGDPLQYGYSYGEAPSTYDNTTKLHFPDGAELTCFDLHTRRRSAPPIGENTGAAYDLEGSFLQFAHVAFARDKCVFAELTADTTASIERTRTYPVTAARVEYAAGDVAALAATQPEIPLDNTYYRQWAWNEACGTGGQVMSLAPTDTFNFTNGHWLLLPLHAEDNSRLLGIHPASGIALGDAPKTNYVARITPVAAGLTTPKSLAARKIIIPGVDIAAPEPRHMLKSIAPYIVPKAGFVALRGEYGGEAVMTAHLRNPFGPDIDVAADRQHYKAVIDYLRAKIGPAPAGYPELPMWRDMARYALRTGLPLAELLAGAVEGVGEELNVGFVGVV